MKSRRFVAVTVLAMALAAPAWADLEKAKDLLSQGDGEAAVEELTTLAYGGDAEAMVLLGDMYHAGDGVAANYSLAWSWYHRASRQNDAEAQYKLGRMMLRGEGAPRNELNALELFERAAKGGHDQAQLEAGLIYRDGRRQIRKSTAKAVEYLTAAAEQGNVEAELALEELFERGDAPRVELSEARVEQPIHDMSEADRIRAAILAWIDGVNRGFEGGAVTPRPEVNVAEVDGGFDVEIPDLVLTTGTSESIRFGTIQLSLTPIGDVAKDTDEDWMLQQRYRIDMTPPTRIELQSGLDVYAITYEASDMSGVWLPALYNFVEASLELRNIQVSDQSGQVVAQADRGDWVVNLRETEPGIWSGPYGMEAVNVTITPPDGGTVTIARVSTETAVDGFNAEPYGRMMNQLNTDPEAFMNTLADPATADSAISEMIDLVASSSFDLTIEDVAYVDPDGNQAFALARLGFGGGAAQDGSDSARLSISYEHSGLDAPVEGPEADLIPRSSRLALDVNRIPMESIARAGVELLGQAMVAVARAESEVALAEDFSEAELQTRFLDILSAAQTGVTIDLAMDSALSGVELAGGVEAAADAMFGVTGAFDLTISNLDEVLAMAEQDPMMAAYKDMLAAFAAVAVREPGDTGEQAKFVIAIQADGNLLVNGENAFVIMSSAMAPPPDGQEN